MATAADFAASFALPAPGAAVELSLPGAAGAIEALLAAPRTPRAGPAFAVVCHPHPLFGGALSNKVAYTLAAAALQAGAYALRFNFRGVGRSGGAHDGGRGETDDTVALVEALRARLPGAAAVLAGFSFGAFVSLKAAARTAPAALVSVAPPFKYFGAEPLPPRPACPWLAIHGDADEVVDYASTRDALQAYAPPPELVTVPGAGHFFHGQLDAILGAAVPFLQSVLAADAGA